VSDIQTPLEPANPTSHRLMLAVVIFLGALIVIALILLVVGMMRKFSEAPAPQAASVSATGAFALPAGSKVVEMQAESGRLILHVRAADGDEIDIVDTQDGHLISQIKAAK
jgi:hypothetical protein